MFLLNLSLLILLLCSTSVVQTAVLPNGERNIEEMGGQHQGDMLFQPQPTGRGVAGRVPGITRWPGGVVPYQFASNISANHTTFIIQMMREMENLTMVNGTQCIRFRERNSSETVFITIFNGSGCYAPVGSWGNYNGVRPVSLMHSPSGTCMISGTIQHELNHALGFYHEQSRPDRDTFVSIQWSNIQSASAFNFDKYNDTEVDTQMTPYDYGSVMHYSANAFAINSNAPTIIAVFNSSANLGQRIRLSPIDILEIQRFYGCVPTPSNPNATTTTTTSTTSRTTTTSTTSRTTSTTSTTTSSATTATSTSTTSRTTTSVTTTSVTTVTTTTVTTATATAGAASLTDVTQSFICVLSMIFILMRSLSN